MAASAITGVGRQRAPTIAMDKATDLKLIADNWETLLRAAALALEEHGRGTLLVDTTRIENSGYPLNTSGSHPFRTTMRIAGGWCAPTIRRKKSS